MSTKIKNPRIRQHAVESLRLATETAEIDPFQTLEILTELVYYYEEKAAKLQDFFQDEDLANYQRDLTILCRAFRRKIKNVLSHNKVN